MPHLRPVHPRGQGPRKVRPTTFGDGRYHDGGSRRLQSRVAQWCRQRDPVDDRWRSWGSLLAIGL